MNEKLPKTADGYFEKPGTETRTKGVVKNPAVDPAEQFERDLSDKAAAYRKVTSKVVTKRYAVRED